MNKQYTIESDVHLINKQLSLFTVSYYEIICIWVSKSFSAQ